MDTILAETPPNTNNGDNAQTWNWNLTTADNKGFTFGENVRSYRRFSGIKCLNIGLFNGNAFIRGKPWRSKAISSPKFSTNKGIAVEEANVEAFNTADIAGSG